MTDMNDTAGQPANDAGSAPEALDLQLAAELVERAKAEGVSLVGPEGLLAGVTKAVLQAALDAEMTEHIGYDKGERPVRGGGNHRNGISPKTVLTEAARLHSALTTGAESAAADRRRRPRPGRPLRSDALARPAGR